MAPFRFLDPAAELRNRMYEEALIHDRSIGLVANVALLRVSKQVHREAKGIFHDLCTFPISATPTTSGVSPCLFPSRNILELSGDLKANFRRGGGNTTLPHMFASFPSEMLQVPTVKLNICIVKERLHEIGPYRGPWRECLSRLIYALAHFLNSDSSARRLYVSCCGALEMFDNTNLSKYVLIPLCTLKEHVNLELTGIPQHMMEALQPKLAHRLTVARDPIDPFEVYEKDHSQLLQYFRYKSQGSSPVWSERACAFDWCLERLSEIFLEEHEYVDEMADFDLLTSSICLEAITMWFMLDDDYNSKYGTAESMRRAQQCLRRCFPIVRHALYPAYDRMDFVENVLAPLCEWFGIEEEDHRIEA